MWNRAMHDGDERPRGGTTKLQFFLIVLACSFAYFIIPGYLFPSISALSTVCWIWKDSITAQQIGSGLYGLGLGSFGFDWTTAVAFTGSSMSYPAFSIFNTLFGFFVTLYVGPIPSRPSASASSPPMSLIPKATASTSPGCWTQRTYNSILTPTRTIARFI